MTNAPPSFPSTFREGDLMRLIGNVAAALAGQLDLRDDHRLLHDSLEARSAPTSC